MSHNWIKLICNFETIHLSLKWNVGTKFGWSLIVVPNNHVGNGQNDTSKLIGWFFWHLSKWDPFSLNFLIKITCFYNSVVMLIWKLGPTSNMNWIMQHTKLTQSRKKRLWFFKFLHIVLHDPSLNHVNELKIFNAWTFWLKDIIFWSNLTYGLNI